MKKKPVIPKELSQIVADSLKAIEQGKEKIRVGVIKENADWVKNKFGGISVENYADLDFDFQDPEVIKPPRKLTDLQKKLAFMTFGQFMALSKDEHIANLIELAKQRQLRNERIKENVDPTLDSPQKIEIRLALFYLCQRDGSTSKNKHIDELVRSGIGKKSTLEKKWADYKTGDMIRYLKGKEIEPSSWKSIDKLSEKLKVGEMLIRLKAKLG